MVSSVAHTCSSYEQDGSSQKLSMRFRRGTREIHQKVEKGAFIQNLIAQKITQVSYCKYLSDLTFVYHVLESQIEDNRFHNAVEAIHIPEIFRGQKLLKDVEALGQNLNQASKSAQAYAVHLTNIGVNKPHLLVAHAYVRYMGDLYVGQKIKQVVEKVWKNATSFYNFDELIEQYQLKAPVRFASRYDERIDQLKLKPQEEKEMVQEAVRAFEFADKMLAELE